MKFLILALASSLLISTPSYASKKYHTTPNNISCKDCGTTTCLGACLVMCFLCCKNEYEIAKQIDRDRVNHLIHPGQPMNLNQQTAHGYACGTELPQVQECYPDPAAPATESMDYKSTPVVSKNRNSIKRLQQEIKQKKD